ncbi:MAG: hypothetical protein M3362_25400 [Acidobacteriota bacterium]|nr:hypothetical protein [Acidobacteriota bacterium]
MMLAEDSNAKSENAVSSEGTARGDERGDVAEADAPTAEEENEGMSTILDADPVTGVQPDAGDE